MSRVPAWGADSGPRGRISCKLFKEAGEGRGHRGSGRGQGTPGLAVRGRHWGGPVWVGCVGQAPDAGSSVRLPCRVWAGSWWAQPRARQAPCPVWPGDLGQVQSLGGRGCGTGQKHQETRSACLKRPPVFRGLLKRCCAGRVWGLGAAGACSELGIQAGGALHRVLVSLLELG